MESGVLLLDAGGFFDNHDARNVATCEAKPGGFRCASW